MKTRVLTALLASLLLTATSAQSAIVYSPGPATRCPSWFFPFGWSVDLDSDGVDDFVFPVGPTIITMDVPTSASWTPFYAEATGTNEFLVSGYHSALQSFSVWVGDNPPLGTSWSTQGASALLTDQWWSLYGRDVGGQLVHWGWGGPLSVSGVGYLGIGFYQADGLHYGWIRVALGLIAVDWAYETRPDTPIRAGDIGSAGESVQFTVEWSSPRHRLGNSDQDIGTGSFILTGNTLRGELNLAGQFSAAQVIGPGNQGKKANPVLDFGQPLVAGTSHTAFFRETTLTHSQIVKLLHSKYCVTVDDGALTGQILPVTPAR